MAFPYRSYDLALRFLRLLSPAVDSGESKVAKGIRGRRHAVREMSDWARGHREADRPLAWFHAPSVGEGLQARAVADALRSHRDDLQLAFTHFSPSAEGLARAMDVDVAGYLPWDTGPEIAGALEALRPDLVAFTKTEVWPTLTRFAHRRGVPVVLMAATLPRDAGRLRFGARHLLASAFRDLDRVLSISPEDGERFGRLGVPEERILVTGDPGIDSAWTRARAADPTARHLAPFARPQRPTLVAGSTWGPDERVLIPALRRVRAEFPDLRVVVAPHEPEEEHVEGLVHELSAGGWRTARFREVEERGEVGDADAVVVDRVGILAELYTVGLVAWVGGGFHDQGLHSVLEPAAAGIPVMFGPRHSNARAAGELLEAGGALEISDERDAERAIRRWFGNEGERRGAGGRAKGYIDAHAGAAGRTAEVLEEMLPPPSKTMSQSAEGR